MQLSHMSPATNHKPPGPSRRDFTLANGSANNQIPNPGNHSSAAIQEAKKPPAPPTSNLSVQVRSRRPNITSPSPMRPSFMRPVPAGLSQPRFRTNGSGDYHGTSSSVSVTTDDSESPSDGGDESALSSEDGFPRSPHGTTSVPRLPPVPFPLAAAVHPSQWRASPSFGSFHSQLHRSWRQLQHSPGRKPDTEYLEDAAGISAEAERHLLRDRVHDQRQKVRQLRADLKEKRREVRALRHKKDEIDNTWMQALRPYLTPSTKTASGQAVAVVPTDFLKKRLDAMQRIRDDYYSVESDYERIEIDLDREESELELFETVLCNFEDSETSRSSSASSDPEYYSSASNGDSSGSDNESSRYTLQGISGELENDVHPLYKELLEAVGDRELAREHHEEIVTHRERTLYDLERGLHRERVKENPGYVLSEAELKSLKLSLDHIPAGPAQFRAKFGVSIDPEELEFLQGYEREEKEVRKGLEEATQNVDRLRALCIEKGLMPKNPRYQEEVAINWPDMSQQEGDISLEDPTPSSTSLASPRFPILLSNPSHVLELLSPRSAADRVMKLPKDYPNVAQLRAECMKELGIDNLMKSVESKPDYINQWLIHRLRTSPMEAELMYSISERTFRIVNPRRWQEDVLYFWRKDVAAIRSPDDFRGPLTSRNGLGVDDVSVRPGVSSVLESPARARSEEGNARPRKNRSRSVMSL